LKLIGLYYLLKKLRFNRKAYQRTMRSQLLSCHKCPISYQLTASYPLKNRKCGKEPKRFAIAQLVYTFSYFIYFI